MLGTYVYHHIIKKTIIGFGTLFNNIEIRRKSNDGKIQSMKVPLAYGPKQKFLVRLQEQPNLNQKVQITLPRISFEVQGLSYDSDRKVSPIQTIKSKNTTDGNVTRTQFVPVPYNIDFSLSIIAKNNDDAIQIIEQILPYFQPSFNISINLIENMNEIKDVPIILNNISYEDDYEGDFEKRRAIIYTLTFTAKTYLYGPVTEQKLIKKAITDTYTNMDTVNTPREIRYVVQPDPVDSDIDDDFGFNEIYSEFSDNMKWNPVTGQDEEII
jgi:hypothetical protein